MAHLGIGRSSLKTVDDTHHFLVAYVCRLINFHHLLVMLASVALVKETQYRVKPITHLTMQTRYLYDNAIMSQTVDKWIGQTFCHQFAVVVI